MEEIVKKKLEELQQLAKQGGKEKMPRSHTRSSLHQIIKTKGQADRFMKMLRSA